MNNDQKWLDKIKSGRWRATTFTFDGVQYLCGSAGGFMLTCPQCGSNSFREPQNYFGAWSPEEKAEIELYGQKSPWGDPSWHKCIECGTQLEPVRMDELESRWEPLWRSMFSEED